MNIIDLYRDYSIPFQTEGHKHCRPGWVNVECPFCEGHNPGLHLGYRLSTGQFTCWRCGGEGKRPDVVISTLLGVTEKEARVIIKEYDVPSFSTAPEHNIQLNKKPFKFPSGMEELGESHIKYLEKRRFDPERLKKIWGIMGTGPIAHLSTGTGKDKKTLDYRFRVIAPIEWDGKIVTFQGRDITNKHPLKYMACPQDREIIYHKNILYGRQDRWGATCFCVEGITDVWRFGVNAFATFGIKFTQTQMLLIAKTFKRVIIAFDPGEKQAKEQAIKLQNKLHLRGVEALFPEGWNNGKNDPGSMPQKEADYLVKQYIK